MTRSEKKVLQKTADEEFLKKEDEYTKLCFDTTSIFYKKMQDILESVKDKQLTHELGYELHHRIPRSFFKKMNLLQVDKNNLYKLTYTQHFMVHYYAYLCATKLMKSAMSLALLEMKRICTKVDGCTESDIIEMSNLFNNIKYELLAVKQKSAKEQSLKFWTKRFENSNYYIESVRRVDYGEQHNTFTKIKIKCKNCEFEFERDPLKFKPTTKCPNCRDGEDIFTESVDVLWFAYDLRYDQAVWFKTTVSYTPSMQQKHERLTKNCGAVKRSFGKKDRYLDKPVVIDVKPRGYEWQLPKSREYVRGLEYIIYSDETGFLTYTKDTVTPEVQRAQKAVREHRGLMMPTYLWNFIFTAVQQDPTVMDRLNYLMQKMAEINSNQSFR